MVKEREQVVASVGRREGVQHALGWVSRNYREQIERWVEDVWLDGISDEQRQGIGNADKRIRSIHDVNLLEQLVAEGRFAGLEGEDSPLQLILTADDLDLDAEQRDYLTQLASSPLHLYTVDHCQPGESFTVRDLLDDKAAVIDISDVYGSRMFDAGDIAGLRLLQTGSGWETSGAIYHIPTEYRVELETLLNNAEADQRAKELIRYWLTLVAAHV